MSAVLSYGVEVRIACKWLLKTIPVPGFDRVAPVGAATTTIIAFLPALLNFVSLSVARIRRGLP